MPFSLLLLLLSGLSSLVLSHPQHAANITRRSDRFYEGAIYVHPSQDSSYPQQSRSLDNVFGSFPPSSPSRQNSFSYCSGGGKCQFFLYCWLSGGSLGSSCGPLFSCCITTNDRKISPQNYGPVRNDPYCGRSATRTSRIVGGNDAYFGQFPWQSSQECYRA